MCLLDLLRVWVFFELQRFLNILINFIMQIFLILLSWNLGNPAVYLWPRLLPWVTLRDVFFQIIVWIHEHSILNTISFSLSGVWQEIQPDLALHRWEELWQLRDSWDQAFHLLLLGSGGHSAFQVRLRIHIFSTSADHTQYWLTLQRHLSFLGKRPLPFSVLLSTLFLRIKKKCGHVKEMKHLYLFLSCYSRRHFFN